MNSKRKTLGFDHSLFIKNDGSLWGMGHDNFGQLGDDTSGSTNRSLVPKQIVSNNVVAVAAGFGHSLFVMSDGSLWAMGLNNLGQLGDGTFSNSLVPIEIVSNNVTAVAGGKFHSLVVSNGALFTTGDNSVGQLGDGTTAVRDHLEMIVASNVTDVAAGGFQSAFLTSDGTARHMGDNTFGELGDGTTILQLFAEPINSLFPTANPADGSPPLAAQFSSSNTDLYGNMVLNRSWDFGDGTAITNGPANPSHTYYVQAGYMPSLSGTLPDGSVVTSYTAVSVDGLAANGGFETGTFSGWTQTGPTSGTGVIAWDGKFGAATFFFPQNFIHSGNFGAIMGPPTLSFLSQTLMTATGASYLVSCWLNADGSRRGDEFQVSWNETILLDLTNVPEVGWQEFHFLVSASGASSALQFGFESPDFLGFDDVGVVPVTPVAASANVTSGPFPLTVHFASPSQDNLGHSITNWDWDFGDGTPHSSSQSPTHTYIQLGTFLPVLLGENNQGGEIAWVSPSISVTTPTLQATASPANGAAPFAVQFTSPATDSGGSAITNWNWDFGDGTTSAFQNPLHTYTVQGVFMPTLTATNSFGIELITLGPPTIQSSGLVANGGFETGDLSGWTLGDTNDNYTYANVVNDESHSGSFSVDLDVAQLSQGVTTEPGSGYLISFWLFSEEGYFADPFLTFWNGNVISSIPNTNLPYGTWTNIQCYVTAGGTNSLLSFFASSSGNLYMDDVSVTPAAVVPFTATPASGPINLTVRFASPPTDTFGQAISTWDWDFGDGSPHSSSPNPTHIYTNTGNYTPVLVATNSAGNQVPDAQRLTITASLPTVQVTANPTNGPMPLSVQFTPEAIDNSGLGLKSWTWTWGDGGTNTSPNPVHTYYEETSTNANPGAVNPFFQPTLIGTNTAGIQVIGIIPPISVDYNAGVISNGGFDTGDFTGWTATGDVAISLSNFGYSSGPCAHFGANTESAGSLAQTIPTTQGADYVLTFTLSSLGVHNGMTISWDGTEIFGGTTNWIDSQDFTNLLFFVTATSSNTALQFAFSGGNYTELLDDVSLMPVASAPAQPDIAHVTQSGTDLVLDITNGQSGKSYQLLTSTNIAQAPALWTPLSTNILGTGGNFTITATNAVNPSTPARFFMLGVQ